MSRIDLDFRRLNIENDLISIHNTGIETRRLFVNA